MTKAKQTTQEQNGKNTQTADPRQTSG